MTPAEKFADRIIRSIDAAGLEYEGQSVTRDWARETLAAAVRHLHGANAEAFRDMVRAELERGDMAPDEIERLAGMQDAVVEALRKRLLS